MLDHPDVPLAVKGRDTMSSAMNEIQNYHRWICSLLVPHLGQRTLEVGPGFGQYTRFFYQHVSELHALDCDGHCLAHLNAVLPSVKTYLADLGQDNGLGMIAEKFDAIVALNVLEHIENDAAAVKNLYEKLDDASSLGGSLLIVVPAHQCLYGEMDRLAGHYRRYDRNALTRLLVDVGFVIKELKYVNPLGGLGWFLNARCYRPASLSSPGVNRQILLFDRWVLPLSRLLTPLCARWFGQSLFCRAVKHV